MKKINCFLALLLTIIFVISYISEPVLAAGLFENQSVSENNVEETYDDSLEGTDNNIQTKAVSQIERTSFSDKSSLYEVSEEMISSEKVQNVGDNTVEENASSGKCGDNLSWTLSEEGVLSISGNGDMVEFDKRPWDSQYINKLIISEGVTSICAYAFYDCDGLTSVELGKSVVTIGEYAFYDCDGLSELAIRGNITSTGSWILDGSGNLKTLQVGKDVSELLEVFYSHNSLEEILVEEGNDTYSSDGGVLYRGMELLRYPKGRQSEGYSILPTTTRIADGAFQYCSLTGEIKVPDQVTEVGAWAFCDCDGLTGVELGKSVVTIGEYAFYDCDGLTGVELGKSVVTIGEYAFYDCDGLSELAIRGNITSTGSWILDGSGNLKTLQVGKDVSELLEVFYSHNSLEEILVEEGNDTYSSDSGVLYRGTDLLKYPTQKKDLDYVIVDGTEVLGREAFANNGFLSELTIPDSLKTIDSYALYELERLVEVILPYGMTSIGECAFYNCINLERIEVPDSVTTIENDVFGSCGKLTIYCGMASAAVEYAEAYQIPFVTDTHCISFDLYKRCSSKTGQEQIRIKESAFDYSFTLFNDTQNAPLKDYRIFSSNIVLGRGSVNAGDQISIKLVSKTGETTDKEVKVTLDDGLSSYTEIEVLQKGSINIKLSDEDVTSILVYNEDGLLKEALECSGEIRTSGYLDCGKYNVILIKGENSLWKYGEIDTFGKKGLQVDKDYMIKSVDVKDGLVTVLSNVAAPDIDLELLRYLDSSSTQYTVNTCETVTGGLLSFRIDYAFSELRKGTIDNIIASITIPAGCNYVTNSATIDGKKVENVTEEGDCIYIPLNVSTGVVRFNARPIEYGKLTTEARIDFCDSGEIQTELVGSIDVSIPYITLDAISKTNKKTINVSGMTVSKEKVAIYDGAVRIGTATANASGKWSGEFSLHNPANNSVHNIVAKVYAGTDKEVESATVNVIYTAQAVNVEQFVMYYNSGSKLDLLDIACKQKPVISFNPAYPFTFTIGLSDNEAVREVYVVSTKGEEEKRIKASFDQEANLWIAEGYFGGNSSYVPGVLSVEYDESGKILAVDTDVELTPFEKDELPDELWNASGTVVKNTYNSENGEGESIVDIMLDNEEKEHFYIATKTQKTSGERQYSIAELRERGYLEVSSQNAEERTFSGTVVTKTGEVCLHSVTFEKGNENSDKEEWIILSYGSDSMDFEMEDDEFMRDEFSKKSIEFATEWMEGEGRAVFSSALGPVVDFLFEVKGVEEDTKQINYAASQIRNSNLPEKEKQRRLLMLHNADCYRAVMLGLKLIPSVIGIGVSIFCPGADVLFWLCSMVVGYYLGNCASSMFEFGLNNALNCDLRWSIDPSGYAYEGVRSNRLEGVRTTIYFKDSEGRTTLWDASEYEQLNPIETDRDGVYAWDVPEGEWCVKFEKEGYETAYSEWVTVPPAQTEVNMGMIAVNHPNVKTCEMYDKCVVIEFDQYIKVCSVTEDTIQVTDSNNKKVKFTIEPIDAVEEGESLLAKQYMLKYDVSLNTESLTVKAYTEILNYAGKGLEKEYSLTKDIVSEIEGLDVEMPEKAGRGEIISIPVSIISEGNYQDYTVICESSSSDIAEVVSVTKPDAGGTATVELKANLPGAVILRFAIEGTHITKDVNLKIENTNNEIVKSIFLNQEAVTIKVDEQFVILAVISPANAEQTIIWSSDDPTVAKVNDAGTVTGVSKGDKYHRNNGRRRLYRSLQADGNCSGCNGGKPRQGERID